MSTIAFSVLMGLGAMVGLGLSNAAVKPVAEERGPAIGVLWRNTLMTLILIVVLFVTRSSSLIEGADYRYIFFSIGLGVAFYAALFLFYKGIAVGKIGVVIPIANGNAFITAILSTLIFKQFLTWTQWVAIICIVGGIILFSVNIREWKSSPIFSRTSGIAYALVVLLMWGVLFVVVSIPAIELGALVHALVGEATIAVMAFIHLLIKKEKSFKLSRRLIPAAIACGLFGATASFTINYGIAYGSIAIVVALMGANPLVAAMYSRVVYKEKLNRREFLAGAITILGIVLIAV